MADRADLDAARWRRIVAGVVGLSKPMPPRPPFARPPVVAPEPEPVLEPAPAPIFRRGKISLSGIPSEMEKLAESWKDKARDG